VRVVPHIATDLDALLDLLVETAGSGAEGGALRLGDAGDWLVDALTERGVTVLTAAGDWPAVQLAQRCGVVVVDPSGDQAPAILHCAAQHVRPGGVVVRTDVRDDGSDATGLAERFELEPYIRFDGDGVGCTVYRRPERFTIHDLVVEARSTIRRVTPEELAAALTDVAPPIVVDTRTGTDRQRHGVIAGSIHVPRTVVEWHLDPANGYRHPAIERFDQPLVIVCNGGYSSSLAAANLVRLGFTDVADLVGGMRAWNAAGLPTVRPDHSHLDL
jgi:rhodanese-related sulfurtransferase